MGVPLCEHVRHREVVARRAVVSRQFDGGAMACNGARRQCARCLQSASNGGCVMVASFVIVGIVVASDGSVCGVRFVVFGVG